MDNDGHPYIANPALRHRLGWDERHDDMAAKIRKEFDLQLPRDRELIRTLALTRIQQGQRVKKKDADLGMSWSPEKGWTFETFDDAQRFDKETESK